MPMLEMIILRSLSGMTAPIAFSICAISSSVFSTRSPVIARTLTLNCPASLCGKSSADQFRNQHRHDEQRSGRAEHAPAPLEGALQRARIAGAHTIEPVFALV